MAHNIKSTNHRDCFQYMIFEYGYLVCYRLLHIHIVIHKYIKNKRTVYRFLLTGTSKNSVSFQRYHAILHFTVQNVLFLIGKLLKTEVFRSFLTLKRLVNGFQNFLSRNELLVCRKCKRFLQY